VKAATMNRLARLWLFAVPVVLSTSAGVAADDTSVIVNPNAAVEFATLPNDLRQPEGITANPGNGDIYVGTFTPGATNALLRYNRAGRLVARKDFPGTAPLLGLAFNADDQKVYLASPGDLAGGTSQVLRIAANFDNDTPVETVAEIPGIGAPPQRTVPNPDGSEDIITFGNNARAPNALTFDSEGNLYVSDSFQGAIFRINGAQTCGAPDPLCMSIDFVAHDSLLATAGFPPFGANGLALADNDQTLYVANTGDDRILRLDLSTSMLEVFVESLNGADGITFDRAGNLWVAANQADHVAVLNQDGRVIAQLGAFLGIRNDGSAKGLLFPASLVIVGNNVYVANAALPLRGDLTEPEVDVTTYIISRIPIPGQLRR